jgi:hypothetical protein
MDENTNKHKLGTNSWVADQLQLGRVSLAV